MTLPSSFPIKQNMLLLFCTFLLAIPLVCYLLIRFKSPRPRTRRQSENHYQSIDHATQPLGSISSAPALDLSIVVPCYNESQRLPVLLNDIWEYLKTHPQLTYELIIMDDGSKDDTCDVALEFARIHGMREMKVVRHVVNRGKGGAVTQGILCSLGKWIMFCDADGATRFSDIDALLKEAQSNSDDRIIAIGSRNNQALSDTVVERSHIRAFLQWGFHTYVYLLGVRGIRDTQCGFKLFSRQAAHEIFSRMHVERFIFDVEVLLLAKYREIRVLEVPVNWHEVEGSKMEIVRDSLQMAVDLLIVRLNYMVGNWTT